MKTNLNYVLNNKMTPTTRLYARWLCSLLVLLFSVSLLEACAPKNEEEQIASNNKRLAPDGYLTKTHLYIHWPAVYTEARRNDPGGKEIVPAITLKIPFEYLGQGSLKIPFLSREEQEALKTNYSHRINTALTIHKNQVTSIFLGMQPGAKPDTPMGPYDTDPPDVAQQKLENFFGFYAVHIRRNDYYAQPISERTTNNSPYGRPPSISCIGTTCDVNFGVKGRLAKISGEGEALDHPNKALFEQTKQKAKSSTSQISANKTSTGTPKWREKVDPTQTMLNSFILPEDSPEIKGMFTVE
jgi:hypothetical protein